MTIRELLAFFGIESEDGFEIGAISDRSDFEGENWVYFNLSSKENAPKYIAEAKKNGAVRILSRYELPDAVFVSDLKRRINRFLIAYHRFTPTFRLIGITGTNGKSTLSNFLKQALKQQNFRVKNIACVREKDAYYSPLTTPDSFSLFRIFQKANNEKLDYLIMEVSSIGIAEGRVEDIDFDELFFTNLSVDHLDYHGTLSAYRKTKIDFFLHSKARKFIEESLAYKTFVFPEKMIVVRPKIREENGKATLCIGSTRLETALEYRNNWINLAFCYAFLRALRLKKDDALKTIRAIRPFKGRMDVVSRTPLIVIDYAHTASSFERILAESKERFKKKICVVFGAGGDRDRTKRKRYAEACNRYCDYAYVTNDNPRSEKPERIAEEICAYLDIPHETILSRKEAIDKAVRLLDTTGMLLILGKGNEDFIQMDGYRIYHNDYDEVERCLKNSMWH